MLIVPLSAAVVPTPLADAVQPCGEPVKETAGQSTVNVGVAWLMTRTPVALAF
jgi:hypothetical protein